MITVIIPVHNQCEYTKNCIASINLQHIDEIIVVDNGSTDDTLTLLASLQVKVIALPNNLGFGKACNLAIAETKSEYIYFLNNDTILKHNTILALLNRIKSDKRLGAVGSKIISPTNTLMEAGCLIRNGHASQRGVFGHPDSYNDFAIVDYCSACSLLVVKELIQDGFDERYSPAYFEDTDMCMQIKQKGYLIGYEPQSIIVHFESITSKSLFNKDQLLEKNRVKFVEKWRL